MAQQKFEVLPLRRQELSLWDLYSIYHELCTCNDYLPYSWPELSVTSFFPGACVHIIIGHWWHGIAEVVWTTETNKNYINQHKMECIEGCKKFFIYSWTSKRTHICASQYICSWASKELIPRLSLILEFGENRRWRAELEFYLAGRLLKVYKIH